MSYQPGNFVDVAADVDPADVVTLDRVTCCYHDVEALLGQAAEKAGTLLGLVHPRDSWPIRPAFRSLNLFFRLRKCPFRMYVHPNPLVQEILSRNGFRRVSYGTTPVWQVSLYARAA